MPVWKFRSFEEAERARWLPTADARLARRLRSLWRTSWEMAGRFSLPRGVFKFHSIEEANAHREAWENERITRIRHQRKKIPEDASADHT